MIEAGEVAAKFIADDPRAQNLIAGARRIPGEDRELGRGRAGKIRIKEFVAADRSAPFYRWKVG